MSLRYNVTHKITACSYASLPLFFSIVISNLWHKLYNSLKGISAKFYTIDDTLILEIDYDYLKIDLEW